MNLPIYDLIINNDEDNDAEVSFVALVDSPAIKKDFLAFKDQFVEPAKGEQKDEFLNRCISYVINEGKETEQAVAICNSLWEQHFAEDSYTDYPKQASENAKIALRWASRKLKNLNEDKISFAIQNESEHIITGALMIPQQLIYRNSEQFGEHYVKFSVETIKQIAIKFSKKGYQKNVNIMHEADMQVEGVTMFESFISDSKRGIKPMEAFKDLPDGTWFGSFYVENPKVWELVKSGEVKGFSVEGMFDYEAPQKPISEDEKQLAELREILNSF